MLREEVILIIKKLTKEDKDRKLHISCNNRIFYNAKNFNFDDDDFLNCDEDKLGNYDILYSLIINIVPKREK